MFIKLTFKKEGDIEGDTAFLLFGMMTFNGTNTATGYQSCPLHLNCN